MQVNETASVEQTNETAAGGVQSPPETPPAEASVQVPGELTKELETLRERLGRTESRLAEAQRSADELRRRRDFERELAHASPVDLETARLVAESIARERGIEDAAEAVREAVAAKPFLFASREPSGVMAPELDARPAGGSIRDAAEEAMRTGDRRAVLRYLRARRGE
ncbi:MAG: hypothetical protein EA423_00070 [Phycisphaerales bacterium]|nr:MAG: hypothetical protein EA423_00070 [Phycisphaerales bacterium]